jgi:hypothetical protein
MNHDALFKMLLRTPTILQSFFEAFVPDAAGFIDFAVLEFVDKELFTIDRKKRTGDLLVKTRFRGQPAGFLIHLEHQAQPDADLQRRMLEYFILDWREYDLPVYPIAVLSSPRTVAVRASPLAVDFPNKRVLCFDFDILDLGIMDAGNYVRTPNPAALALAARMKFTRKNRLSLIKDFALTLARIRMVKRVGDVVASFFFAYQHLDESEDLKLRQEIAKVESKEMRDRVMQLTNPWIEAGKREGFQQGQNEGRSQGRHEGEAELVLKLLARRLGALTATQEKSIRKLPLEKIEELGEALLDFRSRTDLVRWLRLNN